MRSNLFYIAILTLSLVSCAGNRKNNGNEGVRFSPIERTPSLTTSERELAIAEKHSELAVDIDHILTMNGVSFSVLPPAVGEDVPQVASDKLGSRMIQIAAQNGIGGLCTNPILAMVSRVDCIQRELTGTAPQKAIVKYEVTMYCGNFITNDIYASSSQTVTGVGASFADAAGNAMNELNNTPEMQNMLSTASERALRWYGETRNVQRLVDDALSSRDYALAMAILSSVPDQAGATFDYAYEKNKEVSELFFEEKAAELLGELEGAIAAAGEEYNPDLGVYLKLIPVRSSSYPRARQLYDDYLKRVAEVKKEERDYSFEIEKFRLPYETQATIAQIEADAQVGVARANADKAKNANTGGFLGLGKLWEGGFGLVNRLLDSISD